MELTEKELIAALVAEASRIEEDALHSMKGHFNAGSRWENVHLFLGIPGAVLAAWAGVDAFSDSPVMTAILALFAASLVTTITFLSPQQVAEKHQNAGKHYNVLKNRARKFREIDVLSEAESELKGMLEELMEQRDALNSMSPDIPRWAYMKAKRDIDQGTAIYQADKEVTK